MNIAIDGPSGAGKSSLAKAIAKRLGIVYVDTGALYRTVGLYVKRHGICPKDADAVAAVLPDIALSLEFKMGSEVLRTVVVREWEELGILGAIILLRGVLTFLIHWEIKNEEQALEKEESDKEEEE